MMKEQGKENPPKKEMDANEAFLKYRDSFLNCAGAHVPFAEFIKRKVVNFREDAVLRINMSLPSEETQRFLVADISEFPNLEELRVPSPIKDYLITEFFDGAISIKINRIIFDAHRVFLDTYRLTKNSEKRQQFVLFNLRDKTSTLFKEYKEGGEEKQCSIDASIINNFTQMVANNSNVANVLGEKGEVAVGLR